MKRLFFIQLLISLSIAVFAQQSYTIKFNKNDFNYSTTNAILKKSGVYVIKGKIGEEMVTKKIYVK